jgi:hypothetical protein
MKSIILILILIASIWYIDINYKPKRQIIDTELIRMAHLRMAQYQYKIIKSPVFPKGFTGNNYVQIRN